MDSGKLIKKLFRKEYKLLIENVRNYFENARIYSAFNSEYICFSIQESIVNL